MRNILFGFVLGYLAFVFMQGGPDAVVHQISWAFSEILHMIRTALNWLLTNLPNP